MVVVCKYEPRQQRTQASQVVHEPGAVESGPSACGVSRVVCSLVRAVVRGAETTRVI